MILNSSESSQIVAQKSPHKQQYTVYHYFMKRDEIMADILDYDPLPKKLFDQK